MEPITMRGKKYMIINQYKEEGDNEARHIFLKIDNGGACNLLWKSSLYWNLYE